MLAGDERAFEVLVARYDGGLRRVARTFGRTPSAVNDVVHETWLGVLRGVALTPDGCPWSRSRRGLSGSQSYAV